MCPRERQREKEQQEERVQRLSPQKTSLVWYGFPIENGLKWGDDFSPLLFNFVLEYAIRKVQDMNGTQQILAYADDINLIGVEIRSIERNIHALA